MKYISTLLILSLILIAAKAPAPECGWTGKVLWANNLPDEYAVNSFSLHPGPSSISIDFSSYATAPFEADFWTRGGAGLKGAPKPGSQLNDYKIICIAEVPV